MNARDLGQYLRDRDVLQEKIDAMIAQMTLDRTRLDLLAQARLNCCFTAAGLVIGSGDAKKLKVTNTIVGIVDGVLTTVTTEEVVFTDTTVQPISSFTKYLLTYNGAGTGVIVNGNNAVSAVLALLPEVPANSMAVGYVQCATSGAGTFVPATDDLSDAAVTDTYVDLGWVNTGTDDPVALGAHGVAVISDLPPKW